MLTSFELTRFFSAIVLLLVSAHGFGYFFQRLLKAPKVVGEIIGGLVLGPTVLGFFFPSVYRWIFNAFPSEGQLIAAIYWIGLVLLMFISGFEMQRSLDKGDKALIGTLLVGATVIPFIVGWLAPHFYYFAPYIGEKGNIFSLTIIIAIAIAVTSIPVISKIFIDLGIINTRFAKIVLSTATIEDVVLWVGLAIVTGLVSGIMPSLFDIATRVLVTGAFFAVALFVLPRLFEFVNRSRFNLLIKSSATGYLILTCFLFAATASLLDVNIIFGAFLAGIVVGMTSGANISLVKEHIKEFSLGVFIPVYFAVVGLKIDLVHHFDLLFFLKFLFFAVIVKTLGTVIFARLARQDWLSSINLGIAMNTRGGPGIVVATIAFDLGVINATFFSVLVLLAIVTSLMGGYWLRFVLSRGWRLLDNPV
ncbi:MAG: cation:proton antiporter [Negativicutes bacterium]|nr:cation:proton antiporter [Negativicutes bacterium]